MRLRVDKSLACVYCKWHRRQMLKTEQFLTF